MEKEKKNVEKPIVKHKRYEKQIHYRFCVKVIAAISLFILVSIAFIYSIIMSFSITNKEVIDYRQTGNIDYKVYLKDNDFYNTPYLDKDMAYVASLIDKVNMTYNYNFDTTKESDIDITYQVKAKLVIASQNNSKIFFEKEYDLTKEVIDEMVHKKQYMISKSVSIDYNYYNDLANTFKSNYAVNTNSQLEVYLQVNLKNKEDNSYKIVETNKLPLIIPLSQQEVSIKLDDTDVHITKEIVHNSKYVIKDISYFILSLILAFALAVIIFTVFKKLIKIAKSRYSKYDRYINKILRGYDRIIINVQTAPDEKDYNVIKVESFEELVDARDNTKEPINYLIIEKHHSCKFFIINQENMYLYEVNEETINGADNHENEHSQS